MGELQSEKEYRWLEAAKSYEQELQLKPKGALSVAVIRRRIGFCYSLASRQAEDVKEFRRLRQLAVESYESSGRLFEEDKSLENQGKSADCFALAEYTRSWLASGSSERAKALDGCRALELKALEKFEASGDELSFGRACTILSRCLYERLSVASTCEERRRFAQEGIDKADAGILSLSKLGSKEDLVEALSIAGLLGWYFANVSEHEERDELVKRCLSYSRDAVKLSKEVDGVHFKALAMWTGALSTLFFSEEIDSSLEYAKKMVDYSSILRDNYLTGIAHYLIAHITDWMVASEVDPEKKKRMYEDIIKHSEASTRYLQLTCQDSDVAETYQYYTQSFSYLARDFAIKPSDKLTFAKKAIQIGEKGLEYAIRSGSVDATGSILHALSKAYHFCSSLEPRIDERPELLKNALGFRKEFLRIAEQAYPSNFWTIGVGLVYAAQIEEDLAKLEKDQAVKTGFVEDAVSDIETGVTCCNKWIKSRSIPSLVAIVAEYEDTFGRILGEQYSLTNKTENLARANEIYEAAAEKFKQVDLPSRVAESYWRIARNLDLNNDHQKAAENFTKAFAGYKASAQKIHQFSDFYLDYATYMKAWSEIQTAKLAHDKEDFPAAMEHYTRASDLLRQSKLWSYLSSNFRALSLLEQAEIYSRKDCDTEAIEAFEKVIKLLQESERILRAQLIRIDKTDEKDSVVRLIDTSNTRVQYSRGRIEVEEAREYDKKGDHATSSAKYQSAAAIFEKMMQLDSEQTRKEAKPLVYLCEAWQKMTLAEAKSSPIFYEEAADLFKLASECSTNESASMLALAHSNFCKALEAGTEFEITRNSAMYTETKKYMDIAATCYLKAGYETSSEYAKATQRLFDAYVFMNNAKRETDPEKQARHYLMADRVLQDAIEAFSRAKHNEKTLQVQKLLEQVKEERELALSLSEVFHAPTLTSATVSLAISHSEERAVGLERFEHASVQANLIQKEQNIKVGEEASLELQIVNVGKEPVFLTRIENILPQGFQLVNTDDFRVEIPHLIMKERRLEPLKTEELTVVLRSFMMGTFEINPRIVCVDETGRQTFFEPEGKIFNVSMTVLPNRVTTGYDDLDYLLYGGLPENYSVVVTSPSNDERELLIKRFLDAGNRNGETTFYLTAELGMDRTLAENAPSSFYLFVCNPRAEAMAKDLPNVHKLKGVESLTEIDIALAKSFREINEAKSPRR
jgi:tetratricopeptide (TPR) repeat protein